MDHLAHCQVTAPQGAKHDEFININKPFIRYAVMRLILRLSLMWFLLTRHPLVASTQDRSCSWLSLQIRNGRSGEQTKQSK